MKKLITLLMLLLLVGQQAIALEYTDPSLYRSYGKQQIRIHDSKGNKILITPSYKSYEDRNNNVSEKIVAIYDKKAPEGVYGVRYVLYTPIKIGKKVYVGHRKVLQPSPNGYGYDVIYDGGEYSSTPCFRTIQEAKAFYYPQLYNTKPVLRN